jgi:hypothetical protein
MFEVEASLFWSHGRGIAKPNLVVTCRKETGSGKFCVRKRARSVYKRPLSPDSSIGTSLSRTLLERRRGGP